MNLKGSTHELQSFQAHSRDKGAVQYTYLHTYVPSRYIFSVKMLIARTQKFIKGTEGTYTVRNPSNSINSFFFFTLWLSELSWVLLWIPLPRAAVHIPLSPTLQSLSHSRIAQRVWIDIPCQVHIRATAKFQTRLWNQRAFKKNRVISARNSRKRERSGDLAHRQEQLRFPSCRMFWLSTICGEWLRLRRQNQLLNNVSKGTFPYTCTYILPS